MKNKKSTEHSEIENEKWADAALGSLPTPDALFSDDIKCGSSNRTASYNSDTGELIISQNGLVVAIDSCRSEEHARLIASRF